MRGCLLSGDPRMGREDQIVQNWGKNKKWKKKTQVDYKDPGGWRLGQGIWKLHATGDPILRPFGRVNTEAQSVALAC